MMILSFITTCLLALPWTTAAPLDYDPRSISHCVQQIAQNLFDYHQGKRNVLVYKSAPFGIHVDTSQVVDLKWAYSFQCTDNTYVAYTLAYGPVTRQGDGGYENWCAVGYTRDRVENDPTIVFDPAP